MLWHGSFELFALFKTKIEVLGFRTFPLNWRSSDRCNLTH
ncbi:hypothetical protein CKA32_002407 [Geitlerinema sp. FC II]|nr:hypothetical protein CKA32_002407 [Geitlerinema sp. FC II]